MDRTMIAQAPRSDKVVPRHVPSFLTLLCIDCGAPIVSLEAWLVSACPGRPLRGAA